MGFQEVAMPMKGTSKLGLDRGPLNRAVSPHGLAVARRLALVVAGVGCLLVAGCTHRGVPTERWYVDKYERAYDLVLMVIHNIGGEVVVGNRQTGDVTGRFPEEIAGRVVYIDVSIYRHAGGECSVRADTRAESVSVTKEDLEIFRQRFFDAFDAAADEVLRGPEPGVRPTPPVPRLP
jgi:hypothetical protein